MMQHLKSVISEFGNIEDGSLDMGRDSFFLDELLPDPNGLGFSCGVLPGPISDLGEKGRFLEALNLLEPETLGQVEVVPIEECRTMRVWNSGR